MKLYILIKLHTIHVKLNVCDLNCRSCLISIYNSILSSSQERQVHIARSSRTRRKNGPVDVNDVPVDVDDRPVDVEGGSIDVVDRPLDVNDGAIDVGRGPVDVNTYRLT
jgi:hypothetical protein